MQHNGYDDKGPKEVGVFCCIAAGAPGYVDEVGWVEALAAGLAIGVDVRGDDVVEERGGFIVVVIAVVLPINMVVQDA